jgi:hypothetical protein
MNRRQKDFLLMDDDAIYAEAQSRIKKCREKKGKKLDISSLCLKEIPPEITELETLEELDLTCFGLSIHINYDPLTKSEEDFRQNTFIKRDLSWNIEGFGDIDLADYYICYALHVLYSHNEWANEDICRINNILCEVKVTWDRDEF